MNPAPAISFSVDGFTKRSICAPTRTPMAEARTRALALAAKTIHLLFCPSEAKSIVASCVLSPISARKTEMKMAEKALIMVEVYAVAADLKGGVGNLVIEVVDAFREVENLDIEVVGAFHEVENLDIEVVDVFHEVENLVKEFPEAFHEVENLVNGFAEAFS